MACMTVAELVAALGVRMSLDVVVKTSDDLMNVASARLGVDDEGEPCFLIVTEVQP